MHQQNKSKTAKEIVKDDLCYDKFAFRFHVSETFGVEDVLTEKCCSSNIKAISILPGYT